MSTGQSATTDFPPSIEDGGGALLDWLRTMRDERPVWRDGYGVWHVFRYADVHQVVTDHTVFSSDQSRAVPEASDLSRGNLTMIDPPYHRKLRKLVSQAFSARVIAQLEPRIIALCHELLDEVKDNDTVDVVQDLAYPLPVIVIAELLGVPPEDRPKFREWADIMLGANADDPTDPEFIKAFQDSVDATTAYLGQIRDERRSAPREDLMTRLVRAEVDGERLDDEEIVKFAGLLLMSGHVTTTNLLGNAILCLDENPDAATRLRAERDLLPAAVEEVLRYRAPFLQVKRVALHEVELGGVTVPPDEMIMPWLLSANRDERHFSKPDEFDIQRQPNDHLGLGHGVHFCLGAPLARLEARLALGILMDRFSRMEVLSRAPFEPYGWGLFGMKSLLTSVRPG